MRYYIDNFRGLQNQKIISTLANGGAQKLNYIEIEKLQNLKQLVISRISEK